MRRFLPAVVMLLVGLLAFGAALSVQPGESVGAACPFLENTGHPCPTCGMTRSWVWAARGDLVRALRYNPAGATLFAGLLTIGLLGGARLATRNPRLAAPPWQALVVALIAWMALYEGVWLLRLNGYLPLP